jgi:hypothetical protein
MRRSLVFLISLSSVGLTACEDGPYQPFTPAAPNAGSIWNNGQQPPGAAPTTDPGTQGYSQTNVGGTNLEQLCTAPELHARLADAFNRNIIPPIGIPGIYGVTSSPGLDMSGGPSWKGLTIQQAENATTGLCQGVLEADLFGNSGYASIAWGNNGEVTIEYTLNNNKLDYVGLFQGYNGHLGCTPTSPEWSNGSCVFGKSTLPYCVSAQGEVTPGAAGNCGPVTLDVMVDGLTPIKVNGKPFPLKWVAGSSSYALDPGQADLIYDVLMTTYLPAIPVVAVKGAASGGANCLQTELCISNAIGTAANGGGGYMFLPALAAAIWIGYPSVPLGQPGSGSPIRIDVNLGKVFAYSTANPLLKMDAIGPLGPVPAPFSSCTLQIGQTYANYLPNCVQVFTSSDLMQMYDNTEALAKLLGGITHDDETYEFNIAGVDVNFARSGLVATGTSAGATEVVNDADLPQMTDAVDEFEADQSTIGSIANDYEANNPSNNPDWHGSGLVWLEYARLVQDALNAYVINGQYTCNAAGACGVSVGGSSVTPHLLGDPACVPPPGSAPAPGCTGFEGMTTLAPAPGSGPNAPAAGTHVDPTNPYLDQLALGFAPGSSPPYVTGALGQLTKGLHPGNPVVYFCPLPPGWTPGATIDPTFAYLAANGTPDGACTNGALFASAFTQVKTVFGQGSAANLPQDIQDNRFFWKNFATAMFKYMLVAGGPNENPAGVHAVQVDFNSLFFDSAGDGQFESAEYVDRRFAGPGVAPLDLNMSCDVKNDIFNDFDFTRHGYRGETALYLSETVNPADAASPGIENNAVLTNLFGSPILSAGWQAGGNGKSAYYCATNIDIVDCPQVPPMNNCSANPTLCTTATSQLPLVDLGAPVSCTQTADCTTAVPGGACPITKQIVCTTNTDCASAPAGSSCPAGGGFCTNNCTNTCQISCPEGQPCTVTSAPSSACYQMIGDQNGNPLLAAYPAAFAGSQTAFTLGVPSYGITPCKTDADCDTDQGGSFQGGSHCDLTVTPTPVCAPRTITQYQTCSGGVCSGGLFPNYQQAQFDVPQWVNPYDPTSHSAPDLVVMVPWLPKQPGVGFPIDTNGETDRWVESADADFSGTTITANLQYDQVLNTTTHLPKLDPATGRPLLQIEAVSSSDFLGDIFMCQDPVTGDLLNVRMYTAAAVIEQWFANHPGTYTSCGIITKYSPYGNFIDFISSITNGVRVDITTGGGFGRVVGVVLFFPGQ